MRRGSLFLCLLVGLTFCCLALAGPGDGPNGRSHVRSLGTDSVIPEPADGVVNVRDYGAIGNGTANDTAAIQAAIDSLEETGGVVFFPAGQYLVPGQLVLPNDGAAETRQQPYVFRGVGAFYDPRKGIPTGGTILDLRFDGPKIATYGLGLFEASGITFANFGSDSEPFIYTTNTTLHIHGCGFYGNKPHHTADNDGIVLGGTNADGTGGPDPNAPFQGYGTVIRDNYFARVRRIVYGRVYANAVVVTANTAWSNCGTNLPGGAAIELDGDPDDVTAQVNGGWYIAGNLIEMTHYKYGIKTRDSQRNALIANNFYDPGAGTIAYHKFEATGTLNYVVAGFHDDNRPFVEEEAIGINRSTVVDFHQLQESRYAQKTRFLGDVILEPSLFGESPTGPRLRSSGGAELSYRMVDDSGLVFSYTPDQGMPVELWQVTDAGAGTIVQELKGTEAEIRNADGSIKVVTDAGAELQLGDDQGRGLKIDNGTIEITPSGVRLLSGPGVPTANAPDGSIYLRTDGGVNSTFYVRENGVWSAK